MRMTNIRLTPPSRRWVEHARALVAVIGLLLSGGAVLRPVPAQAQTVATLEVMDWNIHHGLDTSGANNLERVVTWIVNVNPHVVSLNEVEKDNGYNDDADEPAVLESALESRTGVPWYACFAQREGAATGQGNLILSRLPIQSCDPQVLSAARSVARATLSVGNVVVTVFSTHLDDASASTRAVQIAELTSLGGDCAGRAHPHGRLQRQPQRRGVGAAANRVGRCLGGGSGWRYRSLVPGKHGGQYQERPDRLHLAVEKRSEADAAVCAGVRHRNNLRPSASLGHLRRRRCLACAAGASQRSRRRPVAEDRAATAFPRPDPVLIQSSGEYGLSTAGGGCRQRVALNSLRHWQFPRIRAGTSLAFS